VLELAGEILLDEQDFHGSGKYSFARVFICNSLRFDLLASAHRSKNWGRARVATLENPDARNVA
jgi:hypothetical protein